MKSIFLFFIWYIFLEFISAKECNLENKCRLVDQNQGNEWIGAPGHYGAIQDCVDDAKDGDTCMIAPGNYHEEVIITNKNNLIITADPELEKPVIDGTVILNPKSDWKADSIGGNTVCVGEIEVTDDKHPFQLFLKEQNDHEMMTNARWPNALWTDKNEQTGTPNVFYNEFWGKSDGTSDRGKMVDKKVDGVSPLAETGLDMKGAMAVLNVGSFNTFVKPVKDHNPGDDFFTYDDDFGDINFKPGQNQYYLDSSEALLDNPGEWYYNMDTMELKFMPLSGSCPDKSSDAVRGRVIDYAFDITYTDGLIIENLDFFASNLQAMSESTNKLEITEIYLDSLNFKFPSSSKRMLQSFQVPKITQVVAHNVGTVSVANCEFVGAEGSALFYWGKNAVVYNNLFKWTDWSGQMGLEQNGGCGTVYSVIQAAGDQFVGNTMWYNGASAGFRPGDAAQVLENLIVGQCVGEIMHDGSGIQIQSGSQPDSLIARNWVFDSPKAGIRFDDSPSHKGSHGTMHKNVIWNAAGYMVKGDFHNITGNLALINNEEKKEDGGILVIHSLRKEPAVMNLNTILEDNAAWLGDGGIDMISTESAPWGRWEMSGLKANNYYGNNSYAGGDIYDGSIVLDKKVIIPEADLPDMLVDVDAHDFRPKSDSILTTTGKQIGPYPAVYKNNEKYAIAGRKEQTASFPIPPNDSTVAMRDSLIFQSAFRCTEEGDKHLVYVTEKDSDFPSNDDPTTEITGDNNVVVFDDIKFTIKSGTEYKWRVDCVEGETSKTRRGDTWSFTMQ